MLTTMNGFVDIMPRRDLDARYPLPPLPLALVNTSCVEK